MNYPRHRVVTITITARDGEVLDRFPVRWWRDPRGDADTEAVGTTASEHLLAERISRYVENK
jgi:hypothetical protein